MAAGDFLSMNRVNVRLASMFGENNPARPEFKQPARSADALLKFQTASVDPILLGSKCVGVKAYFIRHSGQATGIVAAAATCETPCGVESFTVDADYTSEILAQDAGFVEDGRCASETGYEEELAGLIMKLKASMRKQLNEKFIIRLAANAQANTDDGIPGTWDDTANAPIVEIPIAEFSDWQTLHKIDTTIQNNLFDEYLLLTGRNFEQEKWRAGHVTNATNEGAGESAFNEFNIAFDTRDLDRVLARRATLAVDSGAFVFWNTTYDGTQTTPVLMDPSVNSYQWMVPDDFLVWKDKGSTKPVMYMVETKRTCIERTTIGEKRYKTCVYMTLIGGIAMIPDGPNGETGVMEFDAV